MNITSYLLEVGPQSSGELARHYGVTKRYINQRLHFLRQGAMVAIVDYERMVGKGAPPSPIYGVTVNAGGAYPAIDKPKPKPAKSAKRKPRIRREVLKKRIEACGMWAGLLR